MAGSWLRCVLSYGEVGISLGFVTLGGACVRGRRSLWASLHSLQLSSPARALAPSWWGDRLLLSLPSHSASPCSLSQVHLRPQDMSCYNQCLPCQPCGPTPLANSCNEPCVRQCQDSTVVIQPSSVVVTLPGPILSSFPQSTAVGSSTSAAVGSILSSEGVPISSGGFGLSGFGSRLCGRRCLPC